MADLKQTLFCFGYGTCAGVLATRLLAEGWRVRGTTRSSDKAAQMTADGIHPIIWDGTGSLPDAALDDVTHVLVSIAPDAEGDIALRHTAQSLAALTTLVWVGYLSTTGVYGDTDGAWVDEATPVAPETRRSQWRVKAEQQWLAWGAEHGVASHIFRLAGIYGPQRNALRKLVAGTAKRIDAPGIRFSRTHVADIASVLQASIAQPDAGQIYNVCDDQPEAAAVVTAYAAGLLGIDPPPLQTPDEADLSAMGRSFYQSSRRVRNEKIKRELGVALAYPDYKAGLRSLFEAGAY